MNRLAFVLFAASLFACPPAPVPPPNPDADSGADALAPDPELDASAATCATWCTHATKLGCPAGLPTPKGAPCTDVCANMQSGPAPLKLKCRTGAKTCALADACER